VSKVENENKDKISSLLDNMIGKFFLYDDKKLENPKWVLFHKPNKDFTLPILVWALIEKLRFMTSFKKKYKDYNSWILPTKQKSKTLKF
jgi:hypothetical protein